MAASGFLGWVPQISHLIEVRDPIIPIHPPYLFLVGAAKYEVYYPPRFGSSDESRQ